MLLKTKDRCGKVEREAGMCMKKKAFSLLSGNVIENKGVESGRSKG
jgi:hypothetical protein